MTGTESWMPILDTLIKGGPDLEGGAELTVFDPDDGPEVFRAPLARMWRHQPDQPVIWLRPIFGAYQDYEGAPWRFSLSYCRRRSLSYHQVGIDQPDADSAQVAVSFELWNGQRALVRPIRPDLQPTLERWDTFVLTQLPASVEADLEALAEDSWHGEWA